jgi:uncharacterized membrane protein
MRLPQLSALEWVYLAITVFFVIWVSALGILLSVLGASHGYFEDRKPLLILFCALAGLALALELRQL